MSPRTQKDNPHHLVAPGKEGTDRLRAVPVEVLKRLVKARLGREER